MYILYLKISISLQDNMLVIYFSTILDSYSFIKIFCAFARITMRRTRRKIISSEDIAKDMKKQKYSHHAQRKFASAYPSSPSLKDSMLSLQTGPQKAEGFIEFLCVRHAPFLSSELEVFAEPLVNSIISVDELLEIDINDTSGQLCWENDQSILLTPKDVLERKDSMKTSDRHKTDLDVDNVEIITETEMTMITVSLCSYDGTKDLFTFVEKTDDAVVLVLPPTDWVTPSYIQEDCKFPVKTKHIHRLQSSMCENFIIFQAIKKQLERESIKLNEIPQIGLCELDLPLLFETVNLFGGVEAVNADQNWKLIADRLLIPKSASRRVTKLEDIYLKYILPYDLLPALEKAKVRDSVIMHANEFKLIEKEHVSTKSVSLVTFHRMACNSHTMNWEEDATFEKTEKKFWEIVNKGTRYLSRSRCFILILQTRAFFKHFSTAES